jgi:hypothetical protein
MQNRFLTFVKMSGLKLKIEIKDADNMDVNQQHSFIKNTLHKNYTAVHIAKCQVQSKLTLTSYI